MKAKVMSKFKGDLAEIVKSILVEFQEKYESFYNSDKLDDILDQGRDKAHKVSLKLSRKWKKRWVLGRRDKIKSLGHKS